MRFLILLLVSGMISAQNLDKHRWKNRVVVISASASDSIKVEQQFQKFTNKTNTLSELKVVLYRCIGNTCFYYNRTDESKRLTVENVPKYFSISLIGLDGSKKFKSDEIVTSNAIFDLINAMPMRRQELGKKKSKNE